MSKRKILMVAFHYPPVKASSGLQRTLTFSRYLSEDHNWRPTVLTAHARAYATTSDEQLNSIGSGVEVVRAFALDAARHLSVAGRYPQLLSLPDRWVSWWMGAVFSGLRIIRRARPDVIWSTYPIATSHLIGQTLSRVSGIPWVADFRDSMTEDGYPESKSQWDSYRKIESQTVANASAVVFTAPGAREMYQERYPEVSHSRWHVIENGYDEFEFSGVRTGTYGAENAPVHLLHSGLLYRSERDPECFFSALSILKRNGDISERDLRITLRATGDDEYYSSRLDFHDIADLVQLHPAIDYQSALQEMVEASGLLLFQASNCNHQIPAKLYEYIRAGRPILALTDPLGDTAQIVGGIPEGILARLDSVDEIAVALMKLLELARRQTTSQFDTGRYSRRARTAELSTLIGDLAAN